MNTVGPVCHFEGIRGFGNVEGGVLLLGIAPGRNEVRQGKPFVGESGRLLDAILKAAGWSRDNVFCTNLICTWHDELTPQELAACRPRLMHEIEQVRPRLIVTLGKIATEETLGAAYPKKSFGVLQGAVLWTENVLGTTHACYVLPTYHPAAILRGVTAFVHPIYRDLSKIKWVTQELPRAPRSEVPYTVATSVREAEAFLESLEGSAYVALDVESSQGKDADESLDIFTDQLLCVGVSNGDRTLVIPQEQAQAIDWKCYRDRLPWTFHNGLFDTQAMARFCNVRLPIAHDTLLLSYALDERSGIHKLKSLAREFLCAGFYEDLAHGQAKARKGFGKVDSTTLHAYNARDAAYTARLAPILYSQIIEDKVLWPYHNLLIPAANAFADIQYQGIKVDQTRFDQLDAQWRAAWQRQAATLKELGEFLGAPAPFNPNSDKQLKRLVFDILGLEPPLVKLSPKTGAQSLDKEVRESMHGFHPFLTALDTYAKIDHIMTNYMTVIRDNIKLDGRLHSTVKLHGTVTGRTSYTAPAMQTIPNSKYESNATFAALREIFVPCDDQHVIVEADYSKAELYWAVAYSHDEQMATDLASGDFHTLVAADIFKKSIEQVTAWDRTRSKHCSFGILYGRGAPALAKAELQSTVMEAEIFIARWKARYHRYVAWANKQRQVATTQGELVSMTGRKRRFRLILPDDFKSLNEAINAPIQSAASDTTLLAMIRLHDELRPYDSRILLMIHDSLVFEIARAHFDTALATIKRTMEMPQFEGAPAMEIDVSVGDNWGQTHKVKL